MRLLPLALAALLPVAAHAAGDQSAPPVKTQTTTECTGVKVWDPVTKACVNPQDARLDDATRLRAAREMIAWGRPADAVLVLASVTRQATPEVLTLRGFATRRAGDFEAGRVLYLAALDMDPDYILARSYLGQGLVEAGDAAGARTQLDLIRQAGGRGTWAETSLADTLRTGRGYSH